MDLPADDAEPIRADARQSLPVEARFALVFEATPVALVLTGETGRIVLLNRQAELLFGYHRSELWNRPRELLMPQRLHSGGDPYGLGKDGTAFAIEIGRKLIDLDGRSMELFSIIDITARVQNNRAEERQRRELEQSNADLRRSNADLEEFAYAAAHDLKAPLRGIGLLVEWITDDIGAAARQQTAANLKLLQRRLARMRSLLDGLLAYARVGQADVAIEDVDVGELVRDVAAMLSPPSGLEIVCEGEMSPIRTERTPFQVVLENLIGNAVKHHDRDRGRIAVSMRRTEEAVEFRVADDGPGIPRQFQERMFLIFQTLAGADDGGSGGIGLALVKRKVQRHGGRIWVESAPPARGASFVFTWQEAAR